MAARPLVLVVDPYRDARELYELALGLDGLEVRTAATGAEALAIARDAHPSVVLMELRLPDKDGLRVASEIFGQSHGDRPQIVAMSADVLTFTADAARRAGCSVFLQKPCLPEEVLCEVRQALHPN
jgi:two-component system OmpR family response regulator